LICTALHCNALQCNVLYCPSLHSTVLHCMIDRLLHALLPLIDPILLVHILTILHYIDNQGRDDIVTVMHCAALHCPALHCTALHSALLFTALHCTALHCTALHCTELHCTELHCTALHCTVLHCTALHILHCGLVCFFLYWCVYQHRSRDSVSPVCGIFFEEKLNCLQGS
jgi:hypothetical protein